MFEEFVTPESVQMLGFPVVVCGFLLYERMTDRRRQTDELKKQHEQTRETIAANTAATIELCTMIKNQRGV